VSVLRTDTLSNLELFANALYPSPAHSTSADATVTESPNQPNGNRASRPAPASDSVELTVAEATELAQRNLNAATALVARAANEPHAEPTLRPLIARLAELDLALLAELKELLRLAVNALAYRQYLADSGQAHPIIALNAAARSRLQVYASTVAALG
jgi:hypothetical protein